MVHLNSVHKTGLNPGHKVLSGLFKGIKETKAGLNPAVKRVMRLNLADKTRSDGLNPVNKRYSTDFLQESRKLMRVILLSCFLDFCG